MGQQLSYQHCAAWGRTYAGVEQTMMAASSGAAVCSFMAPAMAVARAVLTKVAEKAAQESSLGSMMTVISGANPAAARVGNPDEGLSLDLLEQATAGLKRIQQLSLIFTVFFLNALSPYQHTQMVVACESHSQLQILRAQAQTPRSEPCVACFINVYVCLIPVPGTCQHEASHPFITGNHHACWQQWCLPNDSTANAITDHDFVLDRFFPVPYSLPVLPCTGHHHRDSSAEQHLQQHVCWNCGRGGISSPAAATVHVGLPP